MRAEIKARIALLDKDYIAESDHAIFEKLSSLPEFISANRVFTYFSIGREVDTRCLIAQCSRQNKQVALPAQLNAGSMLFALLAQPPEALPLGKLGIPEPPQDSPVLVPSKGDIIVVPALCYDLSCHRLGQGGGYYDRYLVNCEAFSVGLCREQLLMDSVPTESFDKSTNCLITEKRIARPKKVPQ